MTRAWFIGVITITALAGPSVVEAKTKKERVRDHKAKAFHLFESRDYAAGIAEMEKAYALIPHPGFLLNIAVAFDRWPNHCRESLDAFERFFTECDGCKLLAGAKKQHTEVSNACMVEISIRSKPDGARVAVDGAYRGTTPYSTRLLPGSYVIVLDRSGHDRAMANLEVKRASPQQLWLELAPKAATVALDPPPPSSPPIGATTTVRSGPSAFTWVAFGVGAAGVVTGAAFTVLAVNGVDREEEARNTPLPKAEIEAIQSDAKRDAIIAHVGYGVGLAGVATGVILLLVTGGEEREIAAAPMIGPGVVGLAGSF